MVTAAKFNFKLAHYLPPTHNHARNALPAFVDDAERDSGGRIKIAIYPAEQLLKINEIFDGVKNGVADIGWSMPGFGSAGGIEWMFTRMPGSRGLVEKCWSGGFWLKGAPHGGGHRHGVRVGPVRNFVYGGA